MRKLIITFTILIFSLVLFADFTEDFDGWSDSSYAGVVDYDHTGVGQWQNNNAMVHATYARSGNAVRFNDDSSTTMEYLLYQGLDGNGKDGGLGTISFWYRHWDGNVPSEPIEFIVEYQVGGTAGTWTAIGSSVNVTSTTYTEYSETANVSGDDIFFRIRNIEDKERLLIDDMTVTDYSGGAVTVPVISGISNTPTTPSPSEDVVVSATITDDGTISSAVINWGLATGSLTNNVTMTAVGDVYSGTIPAQADGETVFYTITATDNDLNAETSSERSYDVVLPIVATPYFTPGAGIYSETQSVEILSATVGASIYYTTDGTTPDETSTLYTVALSIDATTTVKAKAFMTGYGPSEVAEALYDFAVAGPATIYISEYLEGSSNNKAIELYNAGPNDVNLGFVEFWRISNGGDWVEGEGNATALSGTLAPGDVYVVCNSSAIPEIQAVSDLVGTSVCYFNGDDAMGLAYNGVLVDVIGTEGADPGSGWDVAGVTNGTANHTILRKLTGTATTDWTASAGTDASDSQWIVNEIDDYSNLGSPTPDSNPIPSITNIVYLPMAPLPTEDVVVTVDITDDDGIDTAVLNWGLASDALSNPIAMTITRDNYTATIPAQADDATVYFNIVATDLVASEATSATMDYTVSVPTVADPTFTPQGDTYTSAQSVEISSTTVDALIYYTLDGTDPDETSTLYTTAISISETTTVKAKAYKVGFTPSAVIEATFTIVTAPAPNIYISEYLEGSSNNKAFEIFNADGFPVDLSMVQIWRISNGGDWTEGAGNAVTLEGILNPGAVWVNANSSSIPEIQALADSVGSSITYFNGDDAMGLAYNGVLIDVVGTEGVDPGTGWDVAGVTNATANHTLIRKASVTTGTTDWAASAGTDASDSQWIVLEQDDYSNLGSTTANFNEVPAITNIVVNPVAPEVGMNVTISADVTDDSAVSSVELKYGTETGVYGTTVTMNTRATYSTVLTTLTAGTYYFVIEATDDEAAVTTSGEQTLVVTEPAATEGIIVSETALDFTATVGETSDVQEYTLQGVDLTDVINLEVSGPFEISDNTLSWDTELFDIDPDYDGSIYVRYSPIAAGSDNGVITHTSDGFDDVLITLTGTGVLPLVAIESEDFEANNLGNWTSYSVIGDQAWEARSYSGNYYAYMSGFAGSAVDNEDWLVSPAMNFDAYENEQFSFDSAFNYTGPTMEVYVATDYVDDPSTATWTLLSPTLSAGGFAWENSGILDLSGYNGTVRVAFKYMSDPTNGAAAWEVDNILIEGTIIQGANTAPVIENISINPLAPGSAEAVTVSADITDADGISSVVLDWGLASDALNNQVPMSLSRSTYNGVIPAQAGGAVVYYTVSATDAHAVPLMATSGINNYSVTADVADIATLRAGATDGTVYTLTGEAVITFLQSYRNQKYIQDATGAILVDDNNGVITSAYALYDGITGLSGSLSAYGGMLQFIPAADPGAASSTGNTVTPAVITLADMTSSFEMYEAQVVTVNNVNFSDVGNFANGTVYALSDGVDTYNFRSTFYDVDYIGTAIPSQPANITGILNSRNEGEFLTARFLTDLDVITTVVATPYFTPEAGTFTETQSVEIMSATADAMIYYTTDGTDPDETSTLYSVAISVSETTTIKAKAYKVGFTPSAIAEALYTITEATEVNIFISEYLEGSSNNKAIEIYNAGADPVNLDLVEFWRISNGGDWVEGEGNATSLSGTLAPGDVYVVCNSSAIPEIQAVSDLIGTSVCYFNGDDAMGLAYNGVLIDVVGTDGADPGSGWDVAGVTDATANHTILRKETVISATTDWALSAGLDVDDSQWIVNAIDDYSNLGFPTGQGGVVTPAIPTNVAIAIDVAGMLVSWDAAADAVTYKIYSATDPFAIDENWTLIGITDGLMWIDPDGSAAVKVYRVISSTDTMPVRTRR